MIDEGISSPHERQRILDIARQRLRHLASLRDPAAFYGHAINDFRQNRRAYGLAA